MLINLLFAFCIFMTVWSTILFIGKLLRGEGFPAGNVLIYTAAITGIVTHIIGIW